MPRITLRSLAVLLAALATTVSARASGLLAPTDTTLPPLRVTDHLVETTVRDGVAITEVTQVFRNDTKRRLEATYLFPLPEDADLTDFQMSFNGKMAQGKVLPAEEAKHVYESIVRQMKDPGLIEFIGRRLLQMRVFPIEPESETTIKLGYQQICAPMSGMQAFHYPLRTRKTAGQAYGTVRFSVDLATSAPLRNIWSPTHAVEIVRDKADEGRARIAYEASGGSLEEDFVLLYQTDASDLGLSVVAHKPKQDESGHFVLMLTPKQLWPDDDPQPQDVVFVLDTSGSMAGDKLAQAKNAIKYCIDRLEPEDRFSVVRFSTGFDVLFDEVEPATDARRATARTWVDDFTAAGGTNITDTLKEVLALAPEDSTRPFVVVFLTDGRGNREANEIMNLLADARTEDAAVRIFPFGVGHDVNTLLLDRLAEDYTGRTTYVQPGQDLELVLGDFFSVISRPVLTDLRLALPEIGATERFPATLGDLYHGQQLIVAGRYTTATHGPVRLTAQRGDERVEFVWPDVSFENVEEATYVPSIWAGRKIAYLVDQIRRHGESTEMVDEILVLSQTYGIQTPYSSWLVNPEQVHPIRAGGGLGGGRRMPPTAARRMAPTETAASFHRLRGALGSAADDLADREVDARRGAPGAGFGDEHDTIDLFLAERAVVEASGEAANLIARKNAAMKERRSRDADRLDRDLLASIQLDGVWFNRLGRYLVDERIGEATAITVVRFASDAYFEFVNARPGLKKTFAASPTIAVLAGKDRAVLISDRTGIEEFSDEDRNDLGLTER